MLTTAVAPDREEAVTTSDGTSLHVTHFLTSGPPRFVVVAIHGFATHAAPYGAFFRKINQAGGRVTAFDCRGHGRSTGRRGFVKRFSEFHDDLELVVARARAEHPHLPFILLGHSHGGTIALDAVLSGRMKPDGLVLGAPWIALYMKPAAWKLTMAGFMSRVWPTFAPGNDIKAEDISSNPEVVADFFKDPLIHHVAAARWYTEVLAAQARIRASANRLAVPTLLLSVGSDRIVDNAALDALSSASSFIQRKHYEGLYHELFLEPTWEQVATDVVAWLTSNVHAHARTEAAPADVPAILRSPP
ncbi:MAG TPA: alpha/beta hydrolase [Polyangia bacterium]